MTLSDPLAHPAWTSLTGEHRRFAESRGRAVRYRTDVAPFIALPPDPGREDWADLAALAGAGTVVPLTGLVGPPPEHWPVVQRGAGVQLSGERIVGAADPEAVLLTEADVPEMLALVERTKPGPFRARTIELGRYLGIRRDGVLIAMAGERLHPPGWTEISAVCTDAAHRGQGLGTRLVLAVAAGIRERDEVPFLHASADNANAIRLYESLGFRLSRRVEFTFLEVPADVPVG
ncbi:GNAT family N-acetyltransferase [Nakamurella leprariae]|uniref:GNAT family N-acetyltransferase n=1 Tax=Nakamurella leprariae TaxID=2803911 RepID=A0A938YA04_9ACTN|nr:GNAT family N-acetyltransferase [Nakamurella leprariae]MBM9466712.1 GNAT family N-acetyltransferase [Nakamurella leprariae]